MQKSTSAFAKRVDMAIKSSPHLARHDLQCVVNEGRVVLTGVVGSYFQKQMAQEAVRRVDGVRRIENQLEVSQGEGTPY